LHPNAIVVNGEFSAKAAAEEIGKIHIQRRLD
jgi:hypothetical protein